MQGPSELGASGRLEHWDRSADLHRIAVPTLVIGSEHDRLTPISQARKIASTAPNVVGLVELPGGPGVMLSELVRALNVLGVSPRDLIAVFEALRQAGALQSELVVM